MDMRRFSQDQERPYGRNFGKTLAVDARTLEPLDYREGFPDNAVELVGGIGLDDEGYPLDAKHEQLAAAKARAAAAKRGATSAAKTKAAAATRSAQKSGTLPKPAQSSGSGPASIPGTGPAPTNNLFSLGGAKSALPYVAVAVVVVVVISHFAMKG